MIRCHRACKALGKRELLEMLLRGMGSARQPYPPEAGYPGWYSRPPAGQTDTCRVRHEALKRTPKGEA